MTAAGIAAGRLVIVGAGGRVVHRGPVRFADLLDVALIVIVGRDLAEETVQAARAAGWHQPPQVAEGDAPLTEAELLAAHAAAACLVALRTDLVGRARRAA